MLVSTTPGNGCLAMAQTDRQTIKQTHGQGNFMTDLAQRSMRSVKILPLGTFFENMTHTYQNIPSNLY